MPSLFSYGTLQDENVQLSTFGRKLAGFPDQLVGYKLIDLQITNPHVVEVSGKEIHQILQKTEIPDDKVTGFVFEISQQELIQADSYEVEDYKRVLLELDSGKSAWIYVDKNHA